MVFRVMLFAGLAERFGTHELDVEILAEAITVHAFKEHLIALYPDQASYIRPCFMAKNQSYADPEQLLGESDELALIPPVSGGQDSALSDHSDGESFSPFVITIEPILPDTVLQKVMHPNHGASISFVGTTRELTAGLRTVKLEYECYIPMAMKTLQQIDDEIQQQWPGTRIAITHRIGTVEIGEISVVIAVSAPHREMCYAASKYAIERLKEIVPIWKKEVWEDGSEWKGSQTGP
ncbi:MAG: molybdenum cofactor biosynthesis protein MoaE [Paenibacillaceae bacterium]